MDYARGYSCSCRLMSVDADTWRDASEIAGVSDISVTRSIDASAPLVDSGDVTTDAPIGREGYVRAWMDCVQDATPARVALGTFLLQASGGEQPQSQAELYSVLQPAEDRKLAAGWYAPEGANGPALSAELLSGVLDAPVTLADGEGGELAANLVSGGESVLSMAWALCGDAWEIVTNGMGRVIVRPRPTKAVTIRECDVIGQVSTKWGIAGIPNRISKTDGGVTAEAVNDDPDSTTSTISRGRVIDGSADGTRLSGETLQAFVERCLEEQSAATETAEYSREWRDDVGIGDRVSLPGHAGAWRVVSQQVACECGAVVQETAKREVTTYAQG